jgi:hypothetical protein
MACRKYEIERYGERFWSVYKLLDNARVLICVCVYKKGALEVRHRLLTAHRCCCGWKPN